MEGQSFFGEEQDYKYYSSYTPFEDTAPNISFKLDKIIPEYWQNKLYFTGLAGDISYPAETLENKTVIHINGGFKVNRARVRIKSFSILPTLILRKNKEIVARGPVGMLIFPPGVKDTLTVEDYKIHATLLPATKIIDGKITFAGMRIDKSAMPVKIEKNDEEVYSGVLTKGKVVEFGDYSLSFTGVKRVLEIGIVRDPGEAVVFVGFIITIAGLIVRLFTRYVHKDTNGSHNK
jgi:cytochrome c biogenesis protein ResB